ncbi:hypothetical protein D3C87_1623150 [compost metagenome]
MAKHSKVTTWHVRPVCSTCDLKPDLLKNFKLGNDLHLADKVVDMVGLHLISPVYALVLAVDEKTSIQRQIAPNRCVLS